MRSFPWEETPLGPVEGWDVALKCALRLLLDCQLPACLAWGDDYTLFYNDACMAALGERRERALGTDARESWSDSWPAIGPMWQKVRAGQPVGSDEFELPLTRHGYAETCHFAFSASPMYGDRGAVAGIYVTFVETTRRVLAERRQAFQIRLADALRRETEAGALLRSTLRLASQYFAGATLGFAEIGEPAGAVVFKESWRNGEPLALAQEPVPLGAAWPGQEHQLAQGQVAQLEDAAGDQVVVPLLEDGKPAAAISLRADAGTLGADERALAVDVARQTWDALRRIRAEQALRDETRLLELLNRTGGALASTLDVDKLLQAITDAATELTGAQFGAFFYNGRDENGEAYMLYTLTGAPRSAFERFGQPRATPVFSPTFHGAAPIRSDDITADPRYGRMAPHYGMPPGHLPVRSYLAASVVSRSGDVLGGLFFGHSEPAVFDARTERLITGIAAQAAIAIDNARLYDMAQRAAQEREALLASERAARAEAEQHNKMKDEFLAMLAHELRNPLAPITSAAQLLRMRLPDERLRQQAVEIIGRQVRHMTSLVDDLLDVSRVTRGLVQLDTEVVDLNEVIGAAVEQARPHIEARRHELALQLHGAAAPVSGDRNRLVQVVANLLNNAAKYTPPGGRIAVASALEPGTVRVTVSDNGSGIDPDLLPRVFELFTQGYRAPDRSQGGLGIGLALVRSIVQMHRGDVAASSAGPGRGASFTVTLPMANVALVTAAREPALRSPPDPAPPLVICIVDDNIDGAQSLAVLLRALGHAVHVFPDAGSVLAAPGLGQVAVFILDIGLPDMTGFELARCLRRDPATAGALLVALTGYGQQRDRDLSREAGFAHHLVKPVQITALAEILAAASPRS